MAPTVYGLLLGGNLKEGIPEMYAGGGEVTSNSEYIFGQSRY
jgi:hypothetical protein